MYDALRMRRDEHVEELPGELTHDVLREATAARSPERVDRLPLEELHDEEHRAVVRRVVVEHPDGAPVLDLVRRVALAEEARTQIGVDRVVRMKELHGDAQPVAMRRAIDRSHAADAEERIEPVLASQRGPHASFGTGFEFVGHRRRGLLRAFPRPRHGKAPVATHNLYERAWAGIFVVRSPWLRPKCHPWMTRLTAE